MDITHPFPVVLFYCSEQHFPHNIRKIVSHINTTETTPCIRCTKEENKKKERKTGKHNV